MWRRKPGFDVCSGAGSARGSRAYLVVARLYAVTVPGTCSHTAECILSVVVSAVAAASKLLAGHGMIDVAALHALTTVASRSWDAALALLHLFGCTIKTGKHMFYKETLLWK